MPEGSLRLDVSNLTGDAVPGLRFDFHPVETGGTAMKARGEGRAITIRGIQCPGGVGALYRVRVSSA